MILEINTTVRIWKYRNIRGTCTPQFPCQAHNNTGHGIFPRVNNFGSSLLKYKSSSLCQKAKIKKLFVNSNPIFTENRGKIQFLWYNICQCQKINWKKNIPTLPTFYWLTGYSKQLFLDLISVELNDKQKSILNDDMTFLNFYKTFLARLNKVHRELLYYPRVSRERPQMLKFYVKIFRTSLFPNPLMNLVIFGMMIDTGPKFYTVPSPPPYRTLRSRSWT